MSEMFVWPYGDDFAYCSPVVLRPSETNRLVFHPALTNNKSVPEEPVLGTLVYQKKRKAEPFLDEGPEDVWVDDVSAKITEAGPGIKVTLKPAEVHKIADVVNRLDAFYKANGLPKVKTAVDLDGPAPGVGLTGDTAELIGRVIRANGVDGLSAVLEWAARCADVGDAVDHLSRLDVADLQTINTVAGLGTLKKLLALWEEQSGNAEERYWQTKLAEYPFLLSQVFAAPLVVVAGRTYLGGQELSGSGREVRRLRPAEHADAEHASDRDQRADDGTPRQNALPEARHLRAV